MNFLTLFDPAFLLWLYDLRDYSTTVFFIGVTELGSTAVVGGLSLALGLWLIYSKAYVRFLGLAVAIGGSAVAVYAMKDAFARARPDLIYQAYHGETDFSFPSGHATMSFAFYGFLAVLAFRMIERRSRKIAVVTLLSVIIFLVGFSRLYLGVHYLSDVVVGNFVGAIFVLLSTIVMERADKILTRARS